MKLSMFLLSLCFVASHGRNLRRSRDTDSTHVGGNDWSFSKLFETLVEKIQDEKVKDGFNRLLKDQAKTTFEEDLSKLSIEPVKDLVTEGLGNLPLEHAKGAITEGLGNLPMEQTNIMSILSVKDSVNEAASNRSIEVKQTVMEDLNNISTEHAKDIIDGINNLNNISTEHAKDIIDGTNNLNNISTEHAKDIIDDISNLDIQHIRDTVIEDVSNVPIEKFKDTVIESLGNLPIENFRETVGKGLGNLEEAKDIVVEGLNSLNNLDIGHVKDTVIEGVGNLPVNFVRETVSEGLGSLAIEHVKASVLESLNNININQVKQDFGNLTLENAKDTLHAYADKIETLQVITDNFKNISTNGIGFDDLKKLTAIIPSNLSVKDGLQAIADQVPKTVLENEALQGYYKDIEGQFNQLGGTLANFFW